jgi:DNA polymerase III subunit delta'
MEFSRVIGHDRQKQMLSTLVGRGKLPHALLFAGPDGVGKQALALSLVANLFCREGTACGSCHPCRALAGGQHPDLTILAGEQSIKIDELRTIRKDVYESPYEAPVRAILINNAEMMTREAANALLKTLEEPPPSNVFILVSAREQEIPLTIRSRCMRIGFGPLPRVLVQRYLEETLNMGGGRAALLGGLSNGSIAAALFWEDEDNFRMRPRIAEVVTGIRRGFTQAALVAEAMTEKGKEMHYLFFLLSFLRDLWWLATTGDPSGITNGDLGEIMMKQGAGSPEWPEKAIRRVQETMRTLRYNVNRWVTMEDLMAHIARPA